MIRHSGILCLVILAPVMAGCGSSEEAPAPPPEITTGLTDAVARDFFEKANFAEKFSRAPGLTSTEVRRIIGELQVDADELTRSAMIMLQASRDRVERTLAAALLGLLKDRQALPALLAALKDDPEKDVRMEVCDALLALGPDPGIQDALTKALDDRNEWVRCRAISALYREPTYRPAERLNQLIRTDKNARVRIEAAKALRDMGQTDGPVLTAFQLGLRNDDLRDECEAALEKLGKLVLPLPEEFYEPIDRKRYDRFLTEAKERKEGRSTKIERKIVKGKKIYFEVVTTELIDTGLPPSIERRWYLLSNE